MKLKFSYNREKDIWCLLVKGKSSQNSPFPTGVYKMLTEKTGDNPNEAQTTEFIEWYLKEKNFNVQELIIEDQKAFDLISDKFQRVAEEVFGVSIDKEITAYLTVNNRCPYNIEENYFFVSISKTSPLPIIMHELWHFYTWYKFGSAYQNKIGPQKYNDVKESLTVLLNIVIVCRDLLPVGIEDRGYPQHQEMRTKIVELWKTKPDISFVWEEVTKTL